MFSAKFDYETLINFWGTYWKNVSHTFITNFHTKNTQTLKSQITNSQRPQTYNHTDHSPQLTFTQI